MNPVTVTILFYATRERFGLTIEEVWEGERDERHVLQSEGGVTFFTPKHKRWFLKWSEFAIVFESAQPNDLPEMAALQVA